MIVDELINTILKKPSIVVFLLLWNYKFSIPILVVKKKRKIVRRKIRNRVWI